MIIFVYTLSHLETQQQWGNGQSRVRTHPSLTPMAWHDQFKIGTWTHLIRKSTMRDGITTTRIVPGLTPCHLWLEVLFNAFTPYAMWFNEFTATVCLCGINFNNAQHDIIHLSPSVVGLSCPIPMLACTMIIPRSKAFCHKNTKVSKVGGSLGL